MFQFDESEKQFQRAQQLIPGGVNSPARAFGGVGGTPVFMTRGEKQFLYDVDGNRYLDFVASWGPHLLGHNDPEIVHAIQTALQNGTSFGAPTVQESELAELIVQAVPSIEKVRLVSSGTEATMSAVRLARGFTGRNKIIKFIGCYHGHVDCLLVQAGSGALTHGVPSSPGVPAGCTQDTLLTQFNDVATLTELFKNQGSEIAAIILEPVVGNMGVVAPLPGFLEACRSLCDQHGTVLIFDEVMTGFRLAYGGAQERFGITPDLTTLGKIVGGGLPVGAYGGRTDIMNHVSPAGPVYQAGTLSGNPLATASGIAMLKALQQRHPYPELETKTTQLCDGLREIASSLKIAHHVAQVGSMFTFFFNENPVTDFSVSAQSDTKRFSKFFHGMLKRGVYFPCSQFEATFMGAAHTQEDLQNTLAAAKDVLTEIAQEN